MGSSADEWALEFLLDQDGLSEGSIRELYEHLSGGGEPLSKTIQARLLLRVLREHAANISEATLNALNCLAATSSDIKSHYSPHANLQNLLPSLDLYLLTKTELVLQTLRGGSVPDILASGAPIHTLNRFFAVSDPSNPAGAPDIPEAEAQRRDELAIGLTIAEGAEALLEKYTKEAAEAAMQAYVQQGRLAMGPSYLKTVELHVAQGIYDPYSMDGIHVQDRFKRQRVGHLGSNADVAAAATITDLQAASKALQGKGGIDPFSGAMQAAGVQLPYQGAVHPDGTPVQGMPDGMQGRTMAWDTPGNALALAPDGTPMSDMAMIGPNGEPLTGDGSMGGKSSKNRAGGGKRRRNGRWSPNETNSLINLVRQYGKGKWKKILEEGGPVFNNRSQVDLKDKWRNLERQGVVGPADSGPAALPGTQQPQQHPDMPQDGQQALDGQHMDQQHLEQQQLAHQQLEHVQQHPHMMEQQHHHHQHQQHPHHMLEQHQQQHMGHDQVQGPQHGDGSEMLAMDGGHDMSGLPDGVAAQQVNIPVNM